MMNGAGSATYWQDQWRQTRAGIPYSKGSRDDPANTRGAVCACVLLEAIEEDAAPSWASIGADPIDLRDPDKMADCPGCPICNTMGKCYPALNAWLPVEPKLDGLDYATSAPPELPPVWMCECSECQRKRRETLPTTTTLAPYAIVWPKPPRDEPPGLLPFVELTIGQLCDAIDDVIPRTVDTKVRVYLKHAGYVAIEPQP